MSNPTFDNVETTLKSLKDIVDRNHSQAVETTQLVEDMETLLAEIKSKAKETNVFSTMMIEPTSLVIHSSAPAVSIPF